MGDLLTAETEVLPPSKTEAEMDTLIMQDGLAWLVQAAINGDPALTAIRVKAIGNLLQGLRPSC